MARTLAEFPDRRNSLNFIRLFLAVLVIVSHAWPIGGYGTDPEIGPFSLGSFAVAGFFAISGWLITQSRLSSELPSFAWRRFVRIYPGYFAALFVVAFVFAPIGAAISTGSYTPADGVRYVSSNITMQVHDWTVGGSLPSSAFQAWNGSLWTLIYEVACYAVIALIVTILGRRRIHHFVVTGLALLTAVAVASQATGASGLRPISALIELSPFFFAGAALFVLRNRIPLGATFAAVATVTLALIVAANAPAALAALPIAYIALWAGAELPRFFQRCGARHDISYGMYIYAFPVQQLLALIGAATLSVGVYVGTCVIATIPFAAASWFLVERPAQRWRRAFDRFPLVRGGWGVRRRSTTTAIP